jgi:hypothetical protein
LPIASSALGVYVPVIQNNIVIPPTCLICTPLG